MSATVASPTPEMAGPDPHGQAALLLVESLIHGLVGNGVLSVEAATSIMEVALDAQVAMADVGRSAAATSSLLEPLLQSLRIDLPR